MRRFYLIGFGLLMAFDTLAQASFKYAANHAMPLSADLGWLLRVFGQPWIYGAFIGYVGAFFTWMSLLKRAPIGPAFAASHLEVVTVMLVSVWLFGERIGPSQTLGALLIIGGIICLAFGEAQEVRRIAPYVGRPDADRADAGRADVGRPDAGRPDAGRPDAGR